MAGLDLAVIGNCTVASGIAPTGRHVWFCFPRLHADPVFNALRGRLAPESGRRMVRPPRRTAPADHGPVPAATRLSRSWEEGLWRAW